MFGLMRLVFIFMAGGLMGVFFERAAHGERCATEGGEMVGAICTGVSE